MRGILRENRPPELSSPELSHVVVCLCNPRSQTRSDYLKRAMHPMRGMRGMHSMHSMHSMRGILRKKAPNARLNGQILLSGFLRKALNWAFEKASFRNRAKPSNNRALLAFFNNNFEICVW
jgi:hypothetical protein